MSEEPHTPDVPLNEEQRRFQLAWQHVCETPIVDEAVKKSDAKPPQDLSSDVRYSSSSSEEEDPKKPADPIGLKFYANAYGAIEEAEKQMRAKRRARLLAVAEKPKKRKLVRRQDSDDSN